MTNFGTLALVAVAYLVIGIVALVGLLFIASVLDVRANAKKSAYSQDNTPGAFEIETRREE